MSQQEPAEFHIDPNDLTEHGLLYRLLIGLNNLPGTPEEINQEILQLPQAVYAYWRSSDHGLEHSRQVIDQVSRVMEDCPTILRAASFAGFSQAEIIGLCNWTALLHDIARFTAYHSHDEHQYAGANLARHCFAKEISDKCCNALFDMIRCHDYIGELFDREKPPGVFIKNPLAELFRLADKTSLDPIGEIARYHATGRRVGVTFFNPDLDEEQRFKFDLDRRNWDQIQYDLLLFSVQPTDWLYTEAAEFYRRWSDNGFSGKADAAVEIERYALYELSLPPLQVAAIRDLINRFHWHHELPWRSPRQDNDEGVDHYN